MRDGAAALNWSFKLASRNADPARYSPESAGHIGFGDRTGAKRDVRQTYLHDAVAAGARVIVGCRAERVLVEGGVAAGVRARPVTGARRVRARRASSSPAARSSLRRCCCARGSAARPSAAICTCTRRPPSWASTPTSSGPGGARR